MSAPASAAATIMRRARFQSPMWFSPISAVTTARSGMAFLLRRAVREAPQRFPELWMRPGGLQHLASPLTRELDPSPDARRRPARHRVRVPPVDVQRLRHVMERSEAAQPEGGIVFLPEERARAAH